VTIEDADTSAGTEASSTTEPTAARPHIPVWQETLILLVIAVLLAVVLKAFFVQAFYIPSESMEPGLVKNDRILVQKVSYWGGGGPQRGDVVVFEDRVAGSVPATSRARRTQSPRRSRRSVSTRRAATS
jgi:signal peptidase I